MMPLQVRKLDSNNIDTILQPQALDFLLELVHEFEPKRREILNLRKVRQKQLDMGEFPNFRDETHEIRSSEWKVGPIRNDLLDRRVEITGPVDRKLIINALNSGANVFMADFEDSHSPTWHATLQGQINLRDAVMKRVSYSDPDNGKEYKLHPETATLMVRPRGWHLLEKNVSLDGEAISASLFDFGIFFFNNAQELIRSGTAPYFYLPKIENYFEARLWNEIFDYSQDNIGITKGTIRATVLIENILASFEMEEILYELREHSAGLNCGRWDYLFSAIRHFRKHPEFSFPDRSALTMTTDFMHNYSKLLIQTCHRRGIHAIGGMAAQIPIRNDAIANAQALKKVRQDKIREVHDGHDGTWVAHPGLVKIAKDVFDEYMPQPNQIDKLPNNKISQKDLLPMVKGDITEEGFLTNIDISFRYIASWLGGTGCVPINNLMEDAATAEISRSQLWQWVNDGEARLVNGKRINPNLYKSYSQAVIDRIRIETNLKDFSEGHYEEAKRLLDKLVLQPEFTEFFTVPAYESLN